jgi:hypothetical protein
MTHWRQDQLWFELVDDHIQHPVMTLAIETPVGRLLVMATITGGDHSLTLRGLHVQSEGLARNAIGPANLAILVRVFM